MGAPRSRQRIINFGGVVYKKYRLQQAIGKSIKWLKKITAYYSAAYPRGETQRGVKHAVVSSGTEI